jgi:release factor glutamine methyltransferase
VTGVNDMETIGAALDYGRSQANEHLTSTTAQALLAHVVGRGRVWLFAHGEEIISPEDAQCFADLIARAAQGEPLAHLVGEREFYGLPFCVTPDVLIPRPETEALVDVVLDWAKEKNIAASRIVDVGTGSGAIAITLAIRLPAARVSAVEVSWAALSIARQNAIRHGVAGRIGFVLGDLLNAAVGPFDVIAANLPYINAEELTALEVGRWEPRVALNGGEDGLCLIRRMLDQVPARLAPGGLLVLEMGSDQGDRVGDLCRRKFPGARVDKLADLAGLDRIVKVETG